MNYTSLFYLIIFLPLVLLSYQLVSEHHRWKVLLFASYLFFYSISGTLLIFLIASTVSIHHIGLWLSSCQNQYNQQKAVTDNKTALKLSYTKKHRRILWCGIILHIGLLLVLKYSFFFDTNINQLFNMLAIPFQLPTPKFLLPIGISFYTLQSVSYLIDVYYGRIEADSNLGRLALFLAFFPSIMEGPICRYSQTADALYCGKPLNYKNITFGAQRILWGLFEKLIIADRLNLLVVKVFAKPDDYSGIIIILAAISCTFQLYMDFAGCINIAIGTGELFGITLPENFRQPFFSKTPSEFWRRWHITLGAWFKDYIFYPISLTKFEKKLGKQAKLKLGKHMGQVITSVIPLFAVWLSNGLWHGTGWNYIFYGMYYFVLIVLGNTVEPWVEQFTSFIKWNRSSIPYRFIQTMKMLIIIFTGELFFRANSLSDGFNMFQSIFTGFHWSTLTDGSILQLKLSINDFMIIILGLIIVLIVGILHEKGISIREKIAEQNILIRWSLYYTGIIAVIVLGAYGNGYVVAKLIYAGF